MKIAILGSGGREHAIAWKLSQSTAKEDLYLLPGNGGTFNNHPIDVNDFASIRSFCEKEGIGLIFVGPEAPLAGGIVDYFADSDIKVFGPSKKAAQLEGSKVWSKNFMQKYGVATAESRSFTTVREASETIAEMKGQLVIKYDGLAAGKGVFVCESETEAHEGLQELAEKYGENFSFLIEERLIGDEISIIGFTDGKDIQLLSPSQDHKQLLDGDKGPNTGGMGAYCPVPFCDEAMLNLIREEIVVPTMKGIQAEELDFKGIIYFGLMMTANGPKLLEYNARLGDPETEVILPAMASDLLELVLACFDGTLKNYEMKQTPGYFVDVVLVSGGYPKTYEKGHVITGIDTVSDEVLVFHAGTKKDEAGNVLSNGGRVINMVGHDADLSVAIQKAYAACEKVHFKDVFYRKDIGQRTAQTIG